MVEGLWWLHVPNVNARQKKGIGEIMKAINRLDFASVQQRKRKAVCVRHLESQSNHSLRVSILHPSKTSSDWQLCMLWLELQAAGLSACYTVNNVNNFPTSSTSAPAVGFVSISKQETVFFALLLRENMLCESGTEQGAQDTSESWVFLQRRV